MFMAPGWGENAWLGGMIFTCESRRSEEVMKESTPVALYIIVIMASLKPFVSVNLTRSPRACCGRHQTEGHPPPQTGQGHHSGLCRSRIRPNKWNINIKINLCNLCKTNDRKKRVKNFVRKYRSSLWLTSSFHGFGTTFVF